MTSIFEVTCWADVASFCIWTLAVCALAKAIFGSMPAAELQYRLTLRDQPKRQRITRLNWEVANRTRWDEDVARGSPHAAAVALSEAEYKARRAELQRLTRGSLPRRALQYLLGCWACQTFWAAVLIYAVTARVAAPAAWFFSAAAYSGAAVLLSTLHSRNPSAHAEPTSARGGCKGCGK